MTRSDVQLVLYQWPATTWGKCSCPSSERKSACAWTGHTAPSTSTTNLGMGGVDQMDSLTAFSNVMITASVRGKNWYWPLFVRQGPQHDHSHFLAHCETEENRLSHLIFRREVILCFLKMDRPIARAQVGGGKSGMMPNGVQRDCNSHQKEPCRVCKKDTRHRY